MSLQPQQFQQLQMFMKPSEMEAMPNFKFGDQAGYGAGGVDRMREHKLTEADMALFGGGASLSEQLRTEGVQEPLAMHHLSSGRSELSNGHHRFFVQERREKAGEEVYLPVRHSGLGLNRTGGH